MGRAGATRLPLRPQTVSELLDAASDLLRRRAARLIGAGFALALAEQAALYPLRRAAAVAPPWYLPHGSDRLGEYWILVAVGFGTEAAAVALLGGPATRAAAAELLADTGPTGGPAGGRSGGRSASTGQVDGLGGRRFGALAVLALLLGAGAAVGTAAGALPGLLWYFLAGLSAPALAVDRRAQSPDGRLTPIGPLRSVGRSMALVTRGGARPGGIRLLGYLAWWAIRIGLGAGSIALLSLVLHDRSGWVWVAAGLAWAVVNAIAYPALACVDAVVHLENRMRVEGLDIALSRARRQGRSAAPALAVPR